MNRNIYSIILLQYFLFLVINGMFGYGWNRREKVEKKLILWIFFLERRGGWKIGRAQVFSSLTYQNFISPIWGENKGKKNSCSQWLNYSSSFHKFTRGLAVAFSLFFFFIGRGPGCFFTSSFFGHYIDCVPFFVFFVFLFLLLLLLLFFNYTWI